MSKDSKQSMDPFTAELEKASLKDIQEAIIWRLGDIQKSTETIVQLSGNCDDTFCHKEVLRSVAHDLRDVLAKMHTIEQYLDMVQQASVFMSCVIS